MANEEVLELQINDNASIAASGLLALSGALVKVKEAIGKGMNLKGTVNGLEKLKNAVNTGLSEDAVSRFERLATVLEKLKGTGAIKISGIKNIANQMNVADSLAEAKEQAQDTANSIAGAVDRGMEEVESRTGEVANTVKSHFSGIKTWFKDVADGFRGIKEEGQDTSGTWNFFNTLGEGIKNARAHIGGLIGDFSRIVKYRMIRSVIKQITQAFTTGIKNVYFYSKAIGGSFAPAMDDAASVLLQFKNSIGAAAAPLIQSLIPYLKMVVNYAIEAINYFNQFISLLRGQSTWTKAIYKNTDAFEDKTKKAKKAGKAIKDLLADWDELNIIQSETGSGGSGAAKAVEDYTKMFEEESKFDNWLSDHFHDVLDMIKMAGVALLGWKLSKNFTGILGKLFKLVAGGAMVALGLKLSFESGFDAGLNGFNTSNILGMIGGALAAGIGGYLITSAVGLGGGIGLAIGVGVAVVASLVGYIKGRQDLADKNKWGNLALTQQQIEEFVRSQFSFDVASEITILDGAISNAEQARNNLNAKILDFKNSLVNARINANINIDSDKTNASIIEAAEQGKAAIKSVNELINASGEGLDVLLKTFKFTNDAGDDISKELLESVKLDNKSLSDYFTGIGDQIASLIEQGEHEHWTNADTKQAVLDLLEREQKILEEANRYKTEFQLDTSIKTGMSTVIDRDTAKKVLEEQKQQLDEYKEKAMALFHEQAEGYDYLAGLAMSAAKDAREHGDFDNAKELEEAAERYHEKASQILDGAEDKIDAKLAETKANMSKEWQETLKVVYGEDFAKDLDAYTSYLSNPAYIDDNPLIQLAQSGKAGEAGNLLKSTLRDYFVADDPNGIVSYVLDELQGNVYDLLDKDMKKQLADNLLEALGGDKNTANEIWRKAFGVNYWATYSKKYIQEVQDSIKQALESGGEMTENEKQNIIAHFGQEAFDKALSELDVAVEPEVTVEPELAWKVDLESANDLNREINSLIDKSGLYGADRKEMTLTLNDLEYNNKVKELKQIYDYIMQNGNEGALNWLDWFAEQKNTGRLGVAQLAHVSSYADSSYNPEKTEYEKSAQQTNEQMAANIESSMKSANEPQNALLRDMILQLTNLNNKQWNVNVYPSSSWGSFNNKSGVAWQNVTGG